MLSDRIATSASTAFGVRTGEKALPERDSAGKVGPWRRSRNASRRQRLVTENTYLFPGKEYLLSFAQGVAVSQSMLSRKRAPETDRSSDATRERPFAASVAD